MPIDTSSMDEKERRKFENLTWTAMRYMREEGLVENNAKITDVVEWVAGDGHTSIKFRVTWLDDHQKVVTKEIVVGRDVLLDYYAHLMNQVGAVASPRSLEEAPPATVRSPVTLPTRKGKTRPIVSAVTWATERKRLYGGVNSNLLNKLRPRGLRLGCVCPASVRPGATTCDHIRWGYITGADNQIGNYRHLIDRPAVGQIVEMPIGMGHIWVKATMSLTPDKKHFAMLSTLDTNLCRILGWPSQPFFMELDEGLIGYIQYLEDMVSQIAFFTKPYEILTVAPAAFDPGNISCGMQHGMTQRSAIVGAVRLTNPDRKNWLLANAVQTLETDGRTCLACAKLEVGVNDVPDI